jgi:hypothetical protein
MALEILHSDKWKCETRVWIGPIQTTPHHFFQSLVLNCNGKKESQRKHLLSFTAFEALCDLGSILQNSILAEKFLDKFSPSNLEQFSFPQKICIQI